MTTVIELYQCQSTDRTNHKDTSNLRCLLWGRNIRLFCVSQLCDLKAVTASGLISLNAFRFARTNTEPAQPSLATIGLLSMESCTAYRQSTNLAKRPKTIPRDPPDVVAISMINTTRYRCSIDVKDQSMVLQIVYHACTNLELLTLDTVGGGSQPNFSHGKASFLF